MSTKAKLLVCALAMPLFLTSCGGNEEELAKKDEQIKALQTQLQEASQKQMEEASMLTDSIVVLNDKIDSLMMVLNPNKAAKSTKRSSKTTTTKKTETKKSDSDVDLSRRGATKEESKVDLSRRGTTKEESKVDLSRRGED